MAEYIDRETALNALQGRIKLSGECLPFFKEYLQGVNDRIKAIPNADVVPRKDYESMEQTVDKLNKSLFFLSTIKRNRAKWIYNDMSRRICSNCGNPVAFKLIDGNWYEGDYCASCGADMRGGEDG